MVPLLLKIRPRQPLSPLSSPLPHLGFRGGGSGRGGEWAHIGGRGSNRKGEAREVISRGRSSVEGEGALPRRTKWPKYWSDKSIGTIAKVPFEGVIPITVAKIRLPP
jgi:hypothetical protein